MVIDALFIYRRVWSYHEIAALLYLNVIDHIGDIDGENTVL